MTEFFIQNRKNPRIHVRFIKKSRSKVFVLFHGMFGHKDSEFILQTEKYLLKKGYSVVSFDYRSHGKSKGSFEEVTTSGILSDINLIFKHTDSYKKVFLFGVSFGGFLSTIATTKYPKISGLVLINPVINMSKIVFRKKTHKELDKTQTKHRQMSFLVKLLFLMDTLNYNLYKKANKIKCPVYVYHIEMDKSVPVQQSKKFMKFLKAKNKFVFPNKSDHGLNPELKTGEYYKKILPNAVSWIEKNS